MKQNFGKTKRVSSFVYTGYYCINIVLREGTSLLIVSRPSSSRSADDDDNDKDRTKRRTKRRRRNINTPPPSVWIPLNLSGAVEFLLTGGEAEASAFRGRSHDKELLSRLLPQYQKVTRKRKRGQPI